MTLIRFQKSFGTITLFALHCLSRSANESEVRESAEEQELKAAKARAKEEAAAKKKARVVTKGGGYKAKKGGTARTG